MKEKTNSKTYSRLGPIAFVMNGAKLTNGEADQRKGIKVSENPIIERTLRGHKECVTSIAFNPKPSSSIRKQSKNIEQQQIASSSLDGTVMLWNYFNCNKGCFRNKHRGRSSQGCSCGEVRAYRYV